MILLDTCTLLWVVADQTRLSDTARKALEVGSGELFVSAISAYELALMHIAGDIQLPFEPLEWFQRSISFHGFQEIPLTGEFAAAAATLPPLHEDICDRLLIGTAVVRELKVLTPDSSISQYPQVQTLF